MTRDELLDIIDKGEWLDIEFKRAANNLPTDVWQTVSAFANTKGGTIGFGIEEINGTFNVHGVENSEKLQSDFLTTLRGEKFNVALSAAAERHEIDGKNILLFHINEMPRQARPIYYGNNIRNSFIRLGSGDQHCSQEEIQRMLREASEQSSDSMFLEGFTEDDLNDDTIKKYRSYLSAYDPSSPLLSLQPNEFLQKVGAISKRRSNNTLGITLAGLLLFGKTEAIQSVMQQYENQYYYLSSSEWGAEDRWNDRVICQENLVETYLIIMERIKRHLNNPFYISEGQRKENTPVMMAIREALVNMLIHQDYFERKIAQVRHFSNSISFINPGSAQLKEAEDLYVGDLTAPRNPIIAKAFRLIGWAELAGTGLLKIIKSWQEMKFELPKIENDQRRYQFSITLSQQHLINEEDKKWLFMFSELNLSEQEKLVLVAAKKYKAISNSQIRLLLGIGDTLAVSQLLSKLCDSNKPLLVKIGTKGPGVRYELNPSSEYYQVLQLKFDFDYADAFIKDLNIGNTEKFILQFCYNDPKSTSEIMDYLNLKDKKNFRNKYLSPLIEKGILNMIYQDKPNHPEQKYYVDKAVVENQYKSKN